MKGRSPAIRKDTLRINEIYLSVQGGSTRAGLPCVFIRLSRPPGGRGVKQRCGS